MGASSFCKNAFAASGSTKECIWVLFMSGFFLCICDVAFWPPHYEIRFDCPPIALSCPKTTMGAART
jgi:hypothetical protein